MVLCGALLVLSAAGLCLYWSRLVQQTNRHAAEQLAVARFQAVKSFIRIDRGMPVWMFDRFDTSEAAAVEDLRKTFAIADSEGRLLEVSAAMQPLLQPVLLQSSALAEPKLRRVGGYIVAVGKLQHAAQRDYTLSVGAKLPQPSLAIPFLISALAIVIMMACFTFGTAPGTSVMPE